MCLCRTAYLESLRKFRAELAAAVAPSGSAAALPRTLCARQREAFELRIETLYGLCREYEQSALKDAELMQLPYRSVPKVAGLHEEIRGILALGNK